MGLSSLALFVTGMWAMVLAVAAFLVAFVAPIGFYLFGSESSRVTVSTVQATILPAEKTPSIEYYPHLEIDYVTVIILQKVC
jgi:hypothetical protein